MLENKAEVKITIPFPVERPNINGMIFTKEAIEEAFNNMSLPAITYSDECRQQDVVIGFVKDKPCTLDYDDERKVCNITLNGELYNCFLSYYINEYDGDTVTDFTIDCVNLSED